jgi:hypothetical protein
MNATARHEERPGGSGGCGAASAGLGTVLEPLAQLGNELGWRDELLWQLTERIRSQRLQQQLHRIRQDTSG